MKAEFAALYATKASFSENEGQAGPRTSVSQASAAA